MDILAASNYGGGIVREQYVFSDDFREQVAGERFGHGGYAYVVDSKALPLLYPPKPDVMHRVVFDDDRAILANLPQIHAAAERDAGSTIGRNYNGTKVLAAWATVSNTKWKVFVEQPESAAFAPLRGKIWKTALLIAAFVLAAVALSILLARRLVRPIKRLQVAAEAIGAGAYDERIELDRKDELGALAPAFNVMAERVQDLIGGLERKVAERTQALEVASKHKSEFLANMSHELRTPLNAIVGFSQVLKQKLFGEVNDKQDEYLDDILTSADHLLALINDILDLCKVEAGQVELEVGSFSLREALERGVVMVRERATKNGVRLSLELDPQIDLVEGDERRIRQVVFNLLSNAVKFTPQGGRVDVSAAKENGEVVVAVTDTGPGISSDDQARIFEEFQQAESHQRRAPRGHRPRPRPVQEPGRAARRPHLGRVRARQGLDLHLHIAGRGEVVKERLVRVLTSLTAKYVALFVLLVAVPSIGISWYLLNSSYNDNKQALIRLEQDKAKSLVAAAAQRLDTTVGELQAY